MVDNCRAAGEPCGIFCERTLWDNIVYVRRCFMFLTLPFPFPLAEQQHDLFVLHGYLLV